MRLLLIASLLLLALANARAGEFATSVQAFDTAAPAPAPSPNFSVCYVCGSKTLHVTKPENVIHFPGQDPITCERLEYGGLNGFINPAYCPLLSAFNIVKICGCKPVDDEEEDVVFQIRQAQEIVEEDLQPDGIDSKVAKEVASLPAPLPDFPVCYICGSKTLTVTKPDNQVKFPGQDAPVPCNTLEYGGLNGFVNPSYCPLLAAFQVAKTCGCAPKELMEGEGTSQQIRQASEATANEQLDSLPDFPVCYVCGSKTLAVTKPNNQVTFPGQSEPISCDKLELGGMNGFINPSYCPLLAAFQVAKTCGCAPKAEDDVNIREAEEVDDHNDFGEDGGSQRRYQTVESEEGAEPDAADNLQNHVSVAPAPSPGYPICYICGSQKKAVTKPDGEVRFPEVEKPVPCYKLEYGGLNGFISPTQCPMLGFFKVPLNCGCKEETEDVIEALEEEHEEEAVESVAEDQTATSGTEGKEVVEASGNGTIETKAENLNEGHNNTSVSTEVDSLSPGYPTCYICGSKKKVVTKPHAQVLFPKVEKPVPCYKLEYGGLNGFISETQCPMLPFFKVPLNCGCKEASNDVIKELEEEHEEEAVESVGQVQAEVLGTEGSGNDTGVQVTVIDQSESTAAKVQPQDDQESSSNETKSQSNGNNEDKEDKADDIPPAQHVVESPGYPVCYICGSSKLAVMQPHVRVTFSGQRPIRCSKLEFGGLNGYISPQLCPQLIIERVPETCGCEPIAWHTNSTSDSEESDNSE